MISGSKIHIYPYYLGFILCDVEYYSSTWLQAVFSVFSNRPGLLVWNIYFKFLKDWVCPHSFVLDLQAACGNHCFTNSVRCMSSTMTMHILQWAFAQHKEICDLLYGSREGDNPLQTAHLEINKHHLGFSIWSESSILHRVTLVEALKQRCVFVCMCAGVCDWIYDLLLIPATRK